MTLNYDVESDYLYLRGIEKGMEKGEERGKESTYIIVIRNMIKKQISSKEIAEMLNLKLSFVEKIAKSLSFEPQIRQALSIKHARIKSIAKKFGVSPVFVEVVKAELKKKLK